MPQFDFNTYLSQIFWLCICLGILLSVSLILTLPKLRQIFEKREKFIDENRQETLSLRAQAASIQKSFELHLEEIKKQAFQAFSQAQFDTEIEISHKKKQIEEEFKKKLDDYREIYEKKYFNIVNDRKTIDPMLVALTSQILAKVLHPSEVDPLKIKDYLQKSQMKIDHLEGFVS